MKPLSTEHSEHKTEYEKPRLLVFGDVAELTNAVGVNATNDGGPVGMTMIKT